VHGPAEAINGGGGGGGACGLERKTESRHAGSAGPRKSSRRRLSDGELGGNDSLHHPIPLTRHRVFREGSEKKSAYNG